MNELDTKTLIDALRQESPAFNAAYILASETHKDQKRVDGRPYMSHIDGVIVGTHERVKDIPALLTREKYWIVAALHDAYEDFPEECSLVHIELKMSSFVSPTALAQILQSITVISKSKEFPRTYDQYMRDIAGDYYACVVKIEDLIYNLNDGEEKFKGKQSLKDKYELSLYFLQGPQDEED